MKSNNICNVCFINNASEAMLKTKDKVFLCEKCNFLFSQNPQKFKKIQNIGKYISSLQSQQKIKRLISWEENYFFIEQNISCYIQSRNIPLQIVLSEIDTVESFCHVLSESINKLKSKFWNNISLVLILDKDSECIFWSYLQWKFIEEFLGEFQEVYTKYYSIINENCDYDFL